MHLRLVRVLRVAPRRGVLRVSSDLTLYPPPRRKPRTRKKDMPIGILGSLVICTVLYVSVFACADAVSSLVRRLPHRRQRSLGHLRCAMSHDGLRHGWGSFGERWRFSRDSQYRHAGHVAGPVACLLLHVQDGLVLEDVLVTFIPSSRTPWKSNHAVRHLRLHFFAGFLPIGIRGRTGQHRDIAGIRDRLRWCLGPARSQAGFAACIPFKIPAMGAIHSDCWHAVSVLV